LPSRYLRTMEWFAGHSANVVVVDNASIGRRYRSAHRIAPVFIPYGANIQRNEGTQALEPWALTPGEYILWVGRLEPETRVEELIEAFGRAALSGRRLVIVGSAPYAGAYERRLRSIATHDVVFTGRQFGEAYQQLSCHALAYVQTSPTSGTSPALLDQMAFGNVVIARGTESNSEVVAEAGLTYPAGDPINGLAAALRSVAEDPLYRDELRRRAVERVREHYSWERVTDAYEALFERLVAHRLKGQGRR
jgi:glycosyltransferase involved in cell wall biosynthesis